MLDTRCYWGRWRRLPAVIACLGAVGCTVIYEYDECRVPGQCKLEDTAALCSDGQDNDDDGLVDCFDPSCNAYCDEDSEALCSDGLDNDGDHLVDCDDESCGATDHCTENTEVKCADGVDNNLDGTTDCADLGCCATKVCHALEVCGELMMEDDFSSGIDESVWLIHRASAGFPGPENSLEVGSSGLLLHAQTACYTYGEELGVIAREPIDLTRGRYYVTARIQVPPDAYWPALIALVPHARTKDFVVYQGAHYYDPCGPPGAVTSDTRQAPVIFHRLFGDGTRNLHIRCSIGSDPLFHFPPSSLVFPTTFDKEVWEVRFDIDDEEIVLFELGEGGWQEVGRAPNLLPGRTLHVALVASTDTDLEGEDNRFTVERVAVYRHERSGWATTYQDNFDEDPGWQGTNPDHCGWSAEKKAMDITFAPHTGETCLATLPTPWTGGSFRLRYDMRADRLDAWSLFAPVLYDASMSFLRGLKAGAGLNFDDPEYYVHSYTCDAYVFEETGPLLDRWLQATIYYDAERNTMEADVIDRNTDEQVAWSWTEDALCLFDLYYFGISAIGYDRYDGHLTHGLIDNVSFMVKESE